MLAASVVTAVSGIPMVLGKVPRNRWYGFRLPITLKDDRIWYPVNKTMGCFLIWIGVIAAVLSVPLFWCVRSPLAMALVFAFMGLSAPLGIAYGARKASKMKAILDERDASDESHGRGTRTV